MPSFLRLDKLTLRIEVLATPGSSRTKISGEHNNRLKIAIKSPPQDGKANQELIKFLAKLLALKQNQIEIIRGQTSREKSLVITDSSNRLVEIQNFIINLVKLSG